MGAFDWFWRAMGSGATRDQKQAKAAATRARDTADALEGASDAELRQHALDALDRDDRPGFLAVLSVVAERTLGMRPFPVQLHGVLRLLDGDVIHMATGEGKTLVGAMAATGFALKGRRVHVITVNDYLARRDADWMRPLVEFFDLVVGSVTSGSTAEERRVAYAADVVYAPVNEIGFDVLRDRQQVSRADMVQTPPDIALVDEADSVLVDEALVPLVLAGSRPGSLPTGRITELVRGLTEGIDFEVDDERRNVFLTGSGAAKLEDALGIDSLYRDPHVGTTLVQVNLALHAKALLLRDVHYIVRDGRIQLIDASRGRVADLQRWPDGLQAAVEAKEGLAVTEGGRILDTITLQALMGRYPTVCGMTGTAVEATDQLRQFYGLRVSVIDRHRPLIREDEPDRIFATREQKQAALVEEIARLHEAGQPVLVGTQDVAESEELAADLAARSIDAAVLNAKNDAFEAEIIAEAGDTGRVTVSTQMAGRGTDIKLGGADEARHDEVAALGGLAVVGTSRHRTARLDNQLRGRAGRQGDPGRSVFFVSLEDDVVAAGGAGERVVADADERGRVSAGKVASFVDHCQRVTESQLLEIHAQTWKYNKLLTDQRAIVDDRRSRLLDTDLAWRELAEAEQERAAELDHVSAKARVRAARQIMLFHLDDCWAEHLALMDDVRESIHLRAIARETPVDEFHRIAVREFKDLARRAIEKSRETFRAVAIDEEGAHLADEGLARPSATWTYMVSDNPLSSRNSVFSGIGNIFR